MEQLNPDGSLADNPGLSVRACHIGKQAVQSRLLGNVQTQQEIIWLSAEGLVLQLSHK